MNMTKPWSRITKTAALIITIIGLIGSTIGIIQFLTEKRTQEHFKDEIKHTIRQEVLSAVSEALQAARKTEKDSILAKNNYKHSITLAKDLMRNTKELRKKIEFPGSPTSLSEAQSRLLKLKSYNSQLIAKKPDIEQKAKEINEARLELANTVNALFELQANVGFKTKEGLTIQKQINQLLNTDKKLEMELRRKDTEQQAIQTEISALQRVIDRNIDMSFKTFQ